MNNKIIIPVNYAIEGTAKDIYLLGDFKAATKEQLVKCIGDRDICGRVLSKMVKKRMIRWNDKEQWYEHSGYTEKEILEAAGLRKALAVYSQILFIQSTVQNCRLEISCI